MVGQRQRRQGAEAWRKRHVTGRSERKQRRKSTLQAPPSLLNACLCCSCCCCCCCSSLSVEAHTHTYTHTERERRSIALVDCCSRNKGNGRSKETRRRLTRPGKNVSGRTEWKRKKREFHRGHDAFRVFFVSLLIRQRTVRFPSSVAALCTVGDGNETIDNNRYWAATLC